MKLEECIEGLGKNISGLGFHRRRPLIIAGLGRAGYFLFRKFKCNRERCAGTHRAAHVNLS